MSAFRVDVRLGNRNRPISGLCRDREQRMDEAIFKAFCAGVEKLTVAQVRQLGQLLRALDARTEVLEG